METIRVLDPTAPPPEARAMSERFEREAVERERDAADQPAPLTERERFEDANRYFGGERGPPDRDD